MKNLLFTLTIVCIGLFSSCDKCKDVDCLNSGTCDKGECECTTFYSGDKCEAEIRADYNATYAGTFGFGDGTSFADTIQLRSFGTDVSKLEIIDGEGIILTLTSATNFNLFAEEIDDSAKYTVSGTGNFSSTAMSLTGTSTEAKNGQIIDVETISFNGIKI